LTDVSVKIKISLILLRVKEKNSFPDKEYLFRVATPMNKAALGNAFVD